MPLSCRSPPISFCPNPLRLRASVLGAALCGAPSLRPARSSEDEAAAIVPGLPRGATYSDGYGGTTGTIGNKRISTYGDGTPGGPSAEIKLTPTQTVPALGRDPSAGGG